MPSLKVFLLMTALVVTVLMPTASADKEHDWTGFVFKGGIETNPEKGGPFKTAEACFAWGKSKVWRASDKYMCGIDCKKDAIGRNYCKSVDSESTAAASVARIEAEEEAAAKKKAEAENPGTAADTKIKSTAKDKTPEKTSAEKAKGVYSSTVRVS